jgi:FixJ family two-component response regulator
LTYELTEEVGRRPIHSVIIDDDRSIGEVLEDIVSRDDVSVRVFADGHEAIEFIETHPVDIVITDLMMPTVGGLEVLDFARQVNPETLVIIITGHASLETAIEAVKKGAYDYIRKPFKIEEFEIAFNNAVERIRLVQQNQELIKELEVAYDRLVEAEKDVGHCEGKDRREDQKIAYLNFFSNTYPGFELLRKTGRNRQDLFERLENTSRLKKDGLLTEDEFQRLKRYIMKQIEIMD